LQKLLIIFLAFASWVSCSTPSDKQKSISSDTVSTEVSFDNLTIPKHWIEITKKGNEWIYSIPCHDIRELQTVDIKITADQKSIAINSGLEGNWYAIIKIKKQADSLLFKTVIPYKTKDTITFSMKYADKEKNIAFWSGGEFSGFYFIPTEDTIKYKRIVEPCDSVKSDDDNIYNLILNLPEVKEEAEYIEKETKGERHLRAEITQSPSDTSGPFIWVRVGEINEIAFATYFWFRVHPKSYEIRYYDVANDTTISLEAWREELKKENSTKKSKILNKITSQLSFQ
jgi:hypothetical protein